MRQSKLQNYMQVAEVCAQRSHDSETKVGAVLVSNESGAILATGYNGFVRGAPDNILPTTRPDKYEYVLHAEVNLIANSSRHGIATNNSTLICTLSPCKHCMRVLINCGITKVIVKELYKDFHEIEKMADVKVDKRTCELGYHHITYSTVE